MKLIEQLKVLANNSSLNITLIDGDNSKLITFNASGYKSVEGDLGEREVEKVQITSVTSANIIIGDAATP